jgi:hypothetical protein
MSAVRRRRVLSRLEEVLAHPFVLKAAHRYRSAFHHTRETLAMELVDAIRMADGGRDVPPLLGFRVVRLDGRELLRVHAYDFSTNAEPIVAHIALDVTL